MTTSPEASTSVPPPHLMGRGTLSRRLVVQVTALVAIIAVALSAMTMVALRSTLQQQQDNQIRELTLRSTAHPNQSTNPGGAPKPSVGTGGLGPQDGLLYFGPAINRTTGELANVALVQNGGTQTTLDAAAQNQLGSVSLDAFKTINIEGVGPYRVYAYDNAAGDRVVIGLPASAISGPMWSVLAAAAAFTLAAILISFFAARQVVARSLQPLYRLATTAHQVSQLELESGEVNLPVRVPESDTDPRSEVGQVGIAFNHMLDNVEGALTARQASEMKVRQFVADASHELRNPLASIRGYAELTRRERGEVPQNTAFALGRIESEAGRMSALVEDLLLLARLDAGTPNLALQSVNLNEVVANAVSDAQVAGPDHEWELSLPEDEVFARADPYRFLQVIANLLSNARTHTPAGTTVKTSLSTEGRFAVVRVADDGPGIPPDMRDKVFERFTRADTARVRSGQGQSTGLGLAIVSAVMDAHGGSATIEATEVGTTFAVRVPLASASISGTTTNPALPSGTPQAG